MREEINWIYEEDRSNSTNVAMMQKGCANSQVFIMYSQNGKSKGMPMEIQELESLNYWNSKNHLYEGEIEIMFDLTFFPGTFMAQVYSMQRPEIVFADLVTQSGTCNMQSLCLLAVCCSWISYRQQHLQPQRAPLWETCVCSSYAAYANCRKR